MTIPLIISLKSYGRNGKRVKTNNFKKTTVNFAMLSPIFYLYQLIRRLLCNKYSVFCNVLKLVFMKHYSAQGLMWSIILITFTLQIHSLSFKYFI